jgi:hypothetical protein
MSEILRRHTFSSTQKEASPFAKTFFLREEGRAGERADFAEKRGGALAKRGEWYNFVNMRDVRRQDGTTEAPTSGGSPSPTIILTPPAPPNGLHRPFFLTDAWFSTLIVKRAGGKNGAQRPRESQKIHHPALRVRPAQPRGPWRVKKSDIFDIYCHYSGGNGVATRHNEGRENFNKSGRSFNKSGTCSAAPRTCSNTALAPLSPAER